MVAAEGSFQILASDRSWPRIRDAGQDCWLEMEACGGSSVESEGVDGVDEGGGGRALLATRDDNDPMRFRKEICNILQSVTISRWNLLQRHPGVGARQNSGMNDSGAIGADELMI